MDEADWAARQEELAWQDLERRIEAARHQEQVLQPTRRKHCQDCGLELQPHRQVAGICVPCLEVREARWRLGL